MVEKLRAIDIAHQASGGEITVDEAEAEFKQIEAARRSKQLIPIPQEHQRRAARVLSKAFGARLKPIGFLLDIQDLREVDENRILETEETVRFYSAEASAVIVGVLDGLTGSTALGIGRVAGNTSFMVSYVINEVQGGWKRGKK